MGLSCYCSEDDDGDWMYYFPSDYSVYQGYRGKRCCSCGSNIVRYGDLCTEFSRFRSWRTEVEEKIYGDGNVIPMADWVMCEACSDQYFNLEALGFCITLGDNMMELLEEYQEMVKEVKK